MTFSAALFVLTFGGYPIVAGLLLHYLGKQKIYLWLKATFHLFLICDIAYYLGYSFRGDYFDYAISSLQYLGFCLFVECIEQTKNVGREIARIAGYILLAIGGLIGVFSLFGINSISAEFDSDKRFFLSNDNHHFVIRKYTDHGWGPFENSAYDLSLYRTISFLPIEKFILKCQFIDYSIEDPRDPVVRILDSSNKKRYLYVQPETDTTIIREIK